MKHLKKILIALLAPALYSGADELRAPFYVGNQNPFVLIYGLPRAEAGHITPKGRLDAAFLYYVSNNAFSDGDGSGEIMIWDGETAQYTLKMRYGLAEYLEVGIDLPYVQHSGGYLDSIIRQFHSIFGFPNDRQEEFEKNQILSSVSDSVTGDSFAMDGPQNGIGDVRLTAALPLLPKSLTSRRYLALRSVLKLPTGDSEHLLGSGGTDVSAGLAYSDFELLGFMSTVIHAHGGILYMSDSDVLAGKHNNLAGYGGLALGWKPWSWGEFKLQADLHSAMYDSDLLQLGHSLQLAAGGTIWLPGNTFLDLGVTEQLSTDATPDYGMYLMLGRRF